MDTYFFNADMSGIVKIERNLPRAILYELALKNNEGCLASGGALVVKTGKYTGRSPNDRFIVKEESSSGHIYWGEINKPFDPAKYQDLKDRMEKYLHGSRVFIQDCYACADPEHAVSLKILTEKAWHSLFVRNMFKTSLPGEVSIKEKPPFYLLHLPDFKADPDLDGTRSEAFVIINFGERTILIGGTDYAGEIKKSVFTVLNYILPRNSVMAMHCSANCGEKGDTALYFGLSGTGKTTLSTVGDRYLIGDDEHGWDQKGIFNFENGCYAKVINLSQQDEPEIYACTHMFGTLMENVVIDETTRIIDLEDSVLAENTRASYPLSSIREAVPEGRGRHPDNIFLLTADAFGVLPPMAKLSPEQCVYYFLSGYTAKVAGTERGIHEPVATFSHCFGAPFMPLYPREYGELLKQMIHQQGVNCWLVNTGWTGGQFGTGHRMEIEHTRNLIRAALQGDLQGQQFEKDPFFGFAVPTSCPQVPSNVLRPRETWPDKAAYDLQAEKLVSKFRENFDEIRDELPEIRQAGP